MLRHYMSHHSCRIVCYFDEAAARTMSTDNPVKTSFREELLRRLQRNGLAAERGAVFLSGKSSLTPGELYVMGFNPGGDPKRGLSIEQQFADFDLFKDFDRFSSFEDECWYSSCDGQVRQHFLDGERQCSRSPCRKGQRRDQLMIKEVVGLLAPMLGIKADLKSIFATNAIFVTSSTVAALENRIELWRKCWPIHQYLLSIVRPKAILCLGYQDGYAESAFGLLSRESNAVAVSGASRSGPRNRSYALIRYFRASLPMEESDPLNCIVIGVPHHARYSTFVRRNLDGMREELKKALEV